MKKWISRIRNVGIVFFSLSIVGLLIYGLYSAMHSSLFLVEVIEVSEDRESIESVNFPIGVDEVRVLANVPVGKASLLSLNLASISKRIEENAWIKQATVEKRFPQTLGISVRYRKPVAIMQRGDVLVYLDENGTEFGEFRLDHRPQLPLIQFNLRRMSSVDIEKYKPKLLRLLSAWKRIEHRKSLRISTISVESGEQILATLFYKINGSKIHRTRLSMSQKIVGSLDYATLRIEKVFEYLQRRSQFPEHIAFHSDKKIVVKTRVGS